MITQEQAQRLASHWIQAWNAHDLDEILDHYTEDVVLVSPVVAKLLDDPLGTVRGKAVLREYFKTGLTVYPNLKFELINVLWGVQSVVFYYTNQNGTKASEVVDIDSTGKIARVIANYDAELME